MYQTTTSGSFRQHLLPLPKCHVQHGISHFFFSEYTAHHHMQGWNRLLIQTSSKENDTTQLSYMKGLSTSTLYEGLEVGCVTSASWVFHILKCLRSTEIWIFSLKSITSQRLWKLNPGGRLGLPNPLYLYLVQRSPLGADFKNGTNPWKQSQ